MTDTTTEREDVLPVIQRTPETEMVEKGGGVGAAADLALEDINPLNAHLFREHRWHRYFERLRKEDPVHLSEIETAGRYWSVVKYDDIKADDRKHLEQFVRDQDSWKAELSS